MDQLIKTTQVENLQQLQTTLPKHIKQVYANFNDSFLITTKKHLVPLLKVLKLNSTYRFEQLTEITVVDTTNATKRFKISYIILSPIYNNRCIVVTYADDISPLQTASNLFNSANWLEREVWDLFGVFFIGNNDLRRILTDYGFNGFALRKDFPLTGFTEIYYNDETKRIVHEPVELAQEFRNFNLFNPWMHH